MKKLLKVSISLLLMVSILMTSSVSVYAGTVDTTSSSKNSISVYLTNYSKKGNTLGTSIANAGYKTIKSTKLNFGDVEPVILNDRTYVPIRVVAEELGYKVGWDDATKSVLLSTVINTSSKNIIQHERCLDLFRDLKTAGTQKKFTKLVNISKYSPTGNVDYIIENYPHLEVDIKMTVNSNVSRWSVIPHQSSRSIGSSNSVPISSIHTGDCGPVIIGGRTLVPLRTVSELLGMDIDWNDATKVITISGLF